MKNNHKESIVYWIDEKLYLNITNKCSNNCKFCVKNYRKGLRGFKLKLSKEPTKDQVIESLIDVINTKNWSEIVFCGFGEPTERLDLLLQVTRWIKRHYGKPTQFRVNTNGQGYLLNPKREVAKELKKAGINKVSVSLNASEEKIYKEICRPKLDDTYQSVIDFIKKAKRELEVEVTAVTTEEINLKKILETADKLGVKFRKREYVPYIF